MKTDTRHRTTFGTRFRFLVRVLALLGVLAAAAGAVVAVPSFPSFRDANGEFIGDPVGLGTAILNGEHGSPAQVAGFLLAGGAAALALWLLVELVSALTLLTGRKTASGTNAAIQVALATALLVIVNALSFLNYQRWDNTRDGEFTIPAELRERLAKLDPKTPTTIVALRVHKTASIAPDRSDNYDAAAERKVVEKVRDLTDVLREFGPTFDVQVLDTEDEDYAEKVKAVAGEDAPFVARLRKDDPARKTAAAAFAAALAAAPENSIFFAANGRFQRMAFNDFLLYDKTASKAEGKDKGERNLVLVPQGKARFIDKLLSVEDRKPVVGLAVVHGLLSSRSENERYSIGALRVVLERNGFEVRDVILKNWGRQLSPAARALDEDEFARTEGKYNLYARNARELDFEVRRLEKALSEAPAALKKVDEALAAKDIDLARLQFATVIDLLQGFAVNRITSPSVARRVLEALEESLPALRQELTDYREKLVAIGPKYDALQKNDRLTEARRDGEVRKRLQEFVDTCDVLVVPRWTVLDLVRGDIVPAWYHNWSQDQAEVVRAFVAAGKPVLFAVGATCIDRQTEDANEPPDRLLDDLLARFGVTLGEQAIFTDAEGEVMQEGVNDLFGRAAEVPALRIATAGPAGKAPNPLADALRRSGQLVDGKLPIRRSGFRPIYLTDRVRAELPFAATVATTGPDSWNESKPLRNPGERYVPRFTPTRLGDPAKGSRDEERRGPFDVAVALEAPVPADWLEPRLAVAQAAAVVAASLPPMGVGFPAAAPLAGLPTDQFLAVVPPAERPKPPTVRLAVFGHGGLFTGTKAMPPGEEALLLHAINWQLRSDERLPQGVPSGTEWKYPRVELDPVRKAAWTGGAVALIPLTCAVLGMIVLMVRRFR